MWRSRSRYGGRGRGGDWGWTRLDMGFRWAGLRLDWVGLSIRFWIGSCPIIIIIICSHYPHDQVMSLGQASMCLSTPYLDCASLLAYMAFIHCSPLFYLSSRNVSLMYCIVFLIGFGSPVSNAHSCTRHHPNHHPHQSSLNSFFAAITVSPTSNPTLDSNPESN